MYRSGIPSFLFVLGNTAMSQSMLVTYSPNDELVIQSTHWSTLLIGHTHPSNFIQDASPSHSIWITTFLVFIPISAKSSSAGITTVMITATYISGSQDPCMLTFLPCLVGPHINLTGGRITTGTGLSAHILFFWIEPLAGGPLFLLPFLGVIPRTLLLMHHPNHFPSTIICICCITTWYCTTTSSLLDSTIL